MRLLITILFILVFNSCGLIKKTSTTETETMTTIKDSVSLRDTTITTEESSSEIKVLLQDLMDGQERISQSGNSTNRVRYNTITKEIESDCDCGEIELILQLMDRIINKETHTTVKTEEKTVKTSFGDMIKYGLTGAAILIIILIIAFVIKKLI